MGIEHEITDADELLATHAKALCGSVTRLAQAVRGRPDAHLETLLAVFAKTLCEHVVAEVSARTATVDDTQGDEPAPCVPTAKGIAADDEARRLRAQQAKCVADLSLLIAERDSAVEWCAKFRDVAGELTATIKMLTGLLSEQHKQLDARAAQS